MTFPRTAVLSIFLALGLLAMAEPPAPPNAGLNGKLYCSVDDEAQILLNGVVLQHAGLGESQSPEVLLKSGDRIVVKLKNVLGKGRFMLLFVTDDHKQIAAFRRPSFKILSNPEKNDFTATEFEHFPKQARSVTGEFAKPYLLPFKSSSEWVWGDQDVCAIGCLLTQDMFKPNPHLSGAAETASSKDKTNADSKSAPDTKTVEELLGQWNIHLQDGETAWDFKPDGTLKAGNDIFTWSISNGALRVTSTSGRTAVLQLPIKNGKMAGKDSKGRDLNAEKAGL